MKIKRQSFYNKFLDILSGYEKIVLIPHNEVDLDSLGSTLGLYTFLSTLHILVTISKVLSRLPSLTKIIS